jgi:aspartate/glutamate racemase
MLVLFILQHCNTMHKYTKRLKQLITNPIYETQYPTQGTINN